MVQQAVALVYRARNLINGKSYIGFTARGLDARKKQHLGMTRQGRGHHFHAAMRKHGIENFVFEVLGDFDGDEDLAKLYEIEAIAKYKPEYNISHGGDGHHVALESRKKIGDANRGKKWSDAQREKMRGVQVGRKVTAETRAKMSLARMGRKPTEETLQKMRGRKMSDAHRAALVVANTGKSPSEETRAKLRAFNLGRKDTEEVRRKKSTANKGRPAHNKGVPHKPEHIAKIRAAQIGKVRTEEAHANMRAAQAKNKRPVICLTDGKVFTSGREAEQFYGLCYAAVTRVARGTIKTTRGLRFAYYVSEEKD